MPMGAIIVTEMARAVKIDTPFPSVLETAKRLGVSKRDATVLSKMAERSEEDRRIRNTGCRPVSARRT